MDDMQGNLMVGLGQVRFGGGAAARKAAAAGAIGLFAPINTTRAGAALRQRKAAAPARSLNELQTHTP